MHGIFADEDELHPVIEGHIFPTTKQVPHFEMNHLPDFVRATPSSYALLDHSPAGDCPVKDRLAETRLRRRKN